MENPKDNKDVIWIADLRSSTLFLFRDQRFKGYCILSFNLRDATSLESLSDAEYSSFFADLRDSSRAIREALSPDHMNYELLGNTNPHLHWHIIPRYRTDPRWGQPIWEGWPRNEFNDNRHIVSEQDYTITVGSIRDHLSL